MTTSQVHTRLRAVTREASFDDFVAEVAAGDFVFKRNGYGMVAQGRSDLVPAVEVATRLQAVEVDDEVQRRGTGAIAVGALPFDADGAYLRIPSRVLGIDEQGAWITEFSGAADMAWHPPTDVIPDMVLDQEAWAGAVHTILHHIDRGEVEKVVLARQVVVEADTEFDPAEVVRRLAVARPDAWVYADGNFVGVTPELLISRVGRTVWSLPMAGTVPVDRAGELSTSPRLVHEFRIVVDTIAEVLGAQCSELAVAAPASIAAGNVSHLSSVVGGRLGDGDPPSALDLALALHPTPAVAGFPQRQALELIEKLEPAPRGRYAGPVGWVDAAGDGEFAMALRCAELAGSRAVLFAGNGIVQGSEPSEEWAETQAKLVAMRHALG
jgi:menaquinone-specific isochorismate synthase